MQFQFSSERMVWNEVHIAQEAVLLPFRETETGTSMNLW